MTESPVVEMMKSAATAAFREWHRHRRDGTAATAEGLAAFDRMKLASSTYAGERAGRELLASVGARAA